MRAVLSPPKPGRNSARPQPLENGDGLTAAEFLRRYEGMPKVKKAELIEGVVYMGSPVRYAQHGQPDGLIQTWLGTYAAETPGTEFVSNTTIQLDIDNVPQPDSLLRVREECGGQTHVDERDYLVGAPELVVEIAAGSASIDVHDKLRAYRRNGVKEYLLWRTAEGALDWLVLREGLYVAQKPDARGVLRSNVFPGLWLALKPLLAMDSAAVLKALHAGLKSKPHRSFVASLAARRSSRRQNS